VRASIDAASLVTPGFIDVHSHLGVYPRPGVNAHSDGNEATDPVTANVWVRARRVAAGSGIPDRARRRHHLAADPARLRQLIGGRGVTLKNVPRTTYQAMKFPNAPQGLKMACGENPKRVYGGQSRAPSTRMGNVAGYRQASRCAGLSRAVAQVRARRRGVSEEAAPRSRTRRTRRSRRAAGAAEARSQAGDAGRGDERRHPVHIHCYRSDEMAIMLDLSKEFGFKISAFHHAIEAYKIADLLAANGVCGAEWADWWGSKMEMFDGIQENIALTDCRRTVARSCTRIPTRHSAPESGSSESDVARQLASA
jgi:imidazolonepropionase-like amidohydrolase